MMSNLYVALNQNQDFQRRLNASVNTLLKHHPRLKEAVDGKNAAEYLMNVLFPDGMPMNYFLSNLNLTEGEDRKITLAARPSVVNGLALPIAHGCSILAKGYWPVNSYSPVFIVQEFVEVADSEIKEFEQAVSVFVRQSDANARRVERPENVLNKKLADSLPLISVSTRDKLHDWYDFISWKKELVSEKAQGLRFINSGIVPAVGKQGFEWFFDIATENKDFLDQVQRVLKRKNISIFSLKASSNEWVFKLETDNKNRRERSLSIGQMAGLKFMDNLPRLFESVAGSGWNLPVFARLSVALSEEQENDMSNVISGKEEKMLITKLESSISKIGFLAISAVGDLALINRHEQALNKLREQGGLSPYLSNYLFDVKKAANPQTCQPITEWHNLALNKSQKEAVTKMVNAPDLCLVQGPPGTGKTTVIAESILQFVKQGKKVILASQAHTAVDNAIDRLELHPSLRVLRLAKDTSKISVEGKAFSEVGALNRYYKSVADHADKTVLAPHKELLKQQGLLIDWLQNAEPVADNWAVLNMQSQSQSDNHGLLFVERNAAWEKLQGAEQQWQEDTHTTESLLELQAYLKTGVCEVMPVNLVVLGSEVTELVRVITDLGMFSVKLSFSFSQWNAEKDQRGAILWSLLRDWSAIQSNLGVLQQDLSRLLATDEKGVGSPELKLQLSQLEAEVQCIETKMESDDAQVVDWISKRAEIKKLKGSTSHGLDSALYQSLFHDAAVWCNATDKPSELAQKLSVRIEAITVQAQLINEARLLLLDVLGKQLAKESPVMPDQSYFKMIDRQYTDQTHALESLEKNISVWAHEAELVFARYPAEREGVQALSLNDFTARILHAKEALHSVVEELKTLELAQGDIFPLVESWVNDLGEKDRAEKDWSHFKETFVASCNVVAISCNENDRTLEEFGLTHFDVAIIDEVSKATPMEMLLPIMRARTTILVGDHRQLPPLFQEGNDAETLRDKIEEADSEGKTRSLLTQENLDRFEKQVTASLFKEHFENADESIRSRLEVQFRMHPQIMDVVNHFYERRLSCGLDNPDQDRAHHVVIKNKFKQPVLTAKDHVFWVDTTRALDGVTMHREDVGRDGKWSRTNRLEARLIANILSQLDEQVQGASKKSEVGVVSFYAAQLKVIREEIKKVRPNGRFKNLDVDVNTVIRYQGKEKSVVLVSLVRHNGRDPEKSGAMPRRQPSRANVARYEFINVAFSRAKNLLMVFGARSMFEPYEVELPSMDEKTTSSRMVYKDILMQLDNDNRIHPAHEMLEPIGDQVKHQSKINGKRY